MSARRQLLAISVIAVTTVGLSAAVLSSASAADAAATFTYTGASQTWTVPAGVTSVRVYAQGAQGGGEYGGLGGGVRGTVAVTPGQQLRINVGGRGAPGVGGFNGGGGSAFGTGTIGSGEGGGGATDLRISDTPVIVAGGGGGGAGGPVSGMGGSGGGTDGEDGQDGDGAHHGGGGGLSGGAGGGGGSFAGAGSGRTGGDGGFGGGGGGGGWFGGGGGGGDSSGGSPGGGGAGSSHAAAAVSAVGYVQGARLGEGQVDLSWGGNSLPSGSSTGTFKHTGGPQLFQVAGDVTSIVAQLVGGQGGAGSAAPGFGADVQATVPVIPGQVLTVMVGGSGGASDGCGALSCDDPKSGRSVGGFNGGGSNTFAGAGTGRGSGGGGATDIRAGSWRLDARVLVAGGGGGAGISGAGSTAGNGGTATGPTGGNGGAGDGIHGGGAGGSSSAGGKNGGSYAGDGRAGQGGAGGFFGGSGGGGWYGGGGGGGDSSGGSPGGGGAGSSYVIPGASAITYTASTHVGDGYASITPNTGPVTTPTGTPPTDTPGNTAPVFTTYPKTTIYPAKNAPGFQIAAQDPDKDLVTISWSLLPLQPVKVSCAAAAPALTATTFCRLTPTSGIDFTNPITFTATDAKGATSTVKVSVGPAYYLAMGDSYASGEGNPPFDTGTDARAIFPFNKGTGTCHRSADSWQRWLNIDAPYALQKHIACSGADTVAMAADSFKGDVGQIKYLKRLSPKPNLIELTVGGNDAGFGIMVGACYAAGRNAGCNVAISKTNDKIVHVLPGRLRSTYRAIHNAAPDAKIVVVGYPNVISTAVTAPLHCPWATASTLRSLSKTAGKLDSAISASVKAMPTAYDIRYVSVLDTLKKHELCTSDAWVNAIQIDPKTIADGTYVYSAHPNDRGQQAVRRAVATYVRTH